MWVDGEGGISRYQLVGFNYDFDGEESFNYISYRYKEGNEKHALFIFKNVLAQGKFTRVFLRWKDTASNSVTKLGKR